MNGPPMPYGDSRTTIPPHLRRNRVVIRVELVICNPDGSGWYDPVIIKDSCQAVPHDMDLDRLMTAVDRAMTAATRSPWPLRFLRSWRRSPVPARGAPRR